MSGEQGHLEDELRERGRRAPAEVLVRDETAIATGVVADGDGRPPARDVRLRLRVEPDGGEAFEAEVTTRDARGHAWVVGQQVVVLYDPHDHDKVAVDNAASIAAGEARRAERAARDAASKAAMDAAQRRFDAAFGWNGDGARTAPESAGAPGADAPEPKVFVTASAADVLAHGVAVRAVVVQAGRLNLRTELGIDLYALVLDVTPDGEAPVRSRVGSPVPANCLALLYPGSNLPAKMLPGNPNAVAIDWESALASTAVRG